MKSPVIQTPRRSSGNGSFAHYFILDNDKTVGVKVLKHSIDVKMVASRYKFFLKEVKERYWFIQEECQSLFAAASAEYVALQMLAGTGNTPIPFGLCWVKGRNNRYQIGIVMEHIQGETLKKWCEENDLRSCPECDKFEAKYRKTWFESFGIAPGDWHSENILVDRKGDYHRIDFSSGYFSLSNESIAGFTRQCVKEIKELIKNAPNKVAARQYPW